MKQTIDEVAEKYRQSTPNKMYGDELGFLAGYNHAQTEIEQLKRDKEELVEALKKCQDAFRENLKKWNYKNEELMFNTLQNNKQLITKHNG
jgi:iron-sulfur cluster repair protein YtfE (RIC family)